MSKGFRLFGGFARRLRLKRWSSHAAGYSQCGGDGGEERDGDLQYRFPGLAFHRFLLILVSHLPAPSGLGVLPGSGRPFPSGGCSCRVVHHTLDLSFPKSVGGLFGPSQFRSASTFCLLDS